jgi:chemotaxis protein methyltransferase CheR
VTADPAELDEFRARLEAEFGLVFDEGRKEQVQEALLARLTDLQLTGPEYLKRLAGDRSEREKAAALLTVPESYFFRHIDQLRVFTDVVLPERLSATGQNRALRILSLGCANGEEPYTLSMLLAEHTHALNGRDVAIRACDLDAEALRRARRGTYTNWALRATPQSYRSRYFTAVGNRYRLIDSVRQSVHFECCNALKLCRAEADANIDIVFFRNVLIYFSPEAIRVAINGVARMLAPGGFLFLGPAETLRGISSEFDLCHTQEAFYYRRKSSPGEVIRMARSAPERKAVEPDPVIEETLAEIPTNGAQLAPFPDSLLSTAWMEEIERSSQRVRGLDAARLSAHGRPRSAVPAAGVHHSSTESLQHFLSLLTQERYADILVEIEALPILVRKDADIELLKALAHLNRREIRKAQDVCREMVVRDSMNASGHYILALCSEHTGDLLDSAEHDQIAIYLDPTFAMPHLHLALLARKRDDQYMARREFENANLLLARESASRLVMFGGGFSRDALRNLCRRELRAMGEK